MSVWEWQSTGKWEFIHKAKCEATKYKCVGDKNPLGA